MKAKEKPESQTRAVLAAGETASALALSFALPFAILGTVFALHGVYPFGGKQILNYDFYHQSYPFFSGFWHKLHEGAVSPWSWTAGAGHDYIALIAYYLASPLNLPAMIAPHALLREAMTIILLVKIGCAGLFTAMYLRYAYKECSLPIWQARPAWPLALPVFSSLYALCAFTLGYYHNIVWFDSFALLPLVMTGLLALTREGKFKLYVVSLALAVLANFYIGYIICVFVAVTFFCQCVMQKFSPQDFLRKLGSIAAYSALAIGMTAALTVPAWFALKNIYSAPNLPPTPPLYTKFFDNIGNFIAFTPPTVIVGGLPNLYTGMISVLLAGLFFQSKKIALREKTALAGTFVFLFISLHIDSLYLMMHGFRYPVEYPARFSFLISFVLAVMAYRAFLSAEGMDWRRQSWRSLLAIGISAALVLLPSILGPQEKKYVTGSAVLCAFYILLFYFLMSAKTDRARAFVKTALFLAVAVELSITSYIGVKTVGTTDRSEYYNGYKQIQALLNMRKKTNIDFYRTDTNQVFSANESYLFNFNGVSFFSSTINPDVMGFMQGLGLNSYREVNNSFYFIATSPLTNAFLNMRYMVSFKGTAIDKNVYWKTVSKIGNYLLLENKYYLPLGFMVDKKLAGYKRHDAPFLSQNDFFRMATGLNGNLFEIFDINASAKNDGEQNITTWGYRIPVTGMAYAYCMIDEPNVSTQIKIYINGAGLSQFPVYDNTPYIFTVGNLAQGDDINFLLPIGKASIYVGYLNAELFDQGYAKLASQALQLTEFTNTKVCGNVTALEDGLLYTSIPADRNWNVYVDGTKSEIVLIDGAMSAVRLNKGYHEVKFRYYNKSLLAGIVISLVSLAVFVILVVFNTRKHQSGKI